MTSECESCGATGDTLTEVHRVYVTPERWDTPGSVQVVDDTEHWCVVCQMHYPHQVVGEEPTD